jgi:two-component system, LytTR family, response regulator LytT
MEKDKTLRIGICDDEEAALDELRRLTSDYGRERHISLDIHGFRAGDELLDELKAGTSFDVLFLDIYIGVDDGVEIARKIREFDKAACIVFATSSPDRALDSYSVRAIQYLVKPIGQESLAQAMDQALAAYPPSMDKQVIIRNKQGNYRIFLGDIVYAESDARVITVHTRSQGPMSFYERLDNFELQCGDRRFLRCHKSFLVNLDYVHSIVNNCALLETGEEIRISMNLSEAKEIFAARAANRI